MVGVFGLRGDREVGIRKLLVAWDAQPSYVVCFQEEVLQPHDSCHCRSMYAPIAALALLGYHAAMLFFRIAGDTNHNSEVAGRILAEALPKSVLELLLVHVAVFLTLSIEGIRVHSFGTWKDALREGNTTLGLQCLRTLTFHAIPSKRCATSSHMKRDGC